MIDSGFLRFLGEEADWVFFLAAAACAPDMRASKAEGREAMALALGFGQRRFLKEMDLGGKRE